ncbi:hypothetical protein DdX_15025 [Ditylenchus destructor]|uniref:Uncharacterized protein n=1 Tax=Ditylenchus destructor TaxID=166010 RepID=A0AAD4R1E0_9BILA|nr:hypothetical protein DdX_15025 [Ditylenchus destructor]
MSAVVMPHQYSSEMKLLHNILAFTNRWELDTLESVNRNFAQVIRLDYTFQPYRLFRKLIIRLINSSDKSCNDDLPCTALYEHQIKKVSFDQVAAIFGHPNIRFASTYIAIDPDYINLEYFFDKFPELTHLWEGKSLTIDMDPHRSFNQVHFFSTLFNDGITTTAGNLAIIDRSYKYAIESDFVPFCYADTSRCRQITIASGLMPELANSIMDWLHDDDALARLDGSCKELAWVFLFDNATIEMDIANVVWKLIRELQKKFYENETPSPYKFWMLNVYHSVDLDDLGFNENTEEMLTFEKNIFEKKRYQSGLEESAFRRNTIDIKVERSLTFDSSFGYSTITPQENSSISDVITESVLKHFRVQFQDGIIGCAVNVSCNNRVFDKFL